MNLEHLREQQQIRHHHMVLETDRIRPSPIQNRIHPRLIGRQNRHRPNRHHRPLESGKARTDDHGTDRDQVQNVIVHPNLIFQMTKHRNRRKKLKRIMGRQHFQNCQI